MNGSHVVSSGERDSPHDVCLVCGSHSLFNVARIFGGNLPKKRASLIVHDEVEISLHEVVLPFSKPHRFRRRVTAGSRRATVISFGESEADEAEREGLAGPKAR
jgi:hypothetical protein